MNVQKVLVKKCGTLSMGDIDEVSALLGELKSGQANTAKSVEGIQNTVAIISENVKDVVKAVTLSGSSIEAAHKYIEEIKQELKDDIRPFIADSLAKESEKKGWADAINWVQVVIGGGIALFGSYIAKMLGLI